MKKKVITLALIALGASGLTGILPISISLSPAEKLVLVESISNRIISPSILASGFLAHEEEVMLSSEVIGKVAELLLRRVSQSVPAIWCCGSMTKIFWQGLSNPKPL